MRDFVWRPEQSPPPEADAPTMGDARRGLSSSDPIVVAIVAGVVLSGVLAWMGLPPAATTAVVKGLSGTHAEHGSAGQAHGAPAASSARPPLWTVTPFLLLLGSIAVLPLIRYTEQWWESNLHRFYVAAGLAFVTLLYYALFHQQPVEGHWPSHYIAQPAGDVIQTGLAWTVLENAILAEYIPFIVLLFSLYTITGGIRIEGDLRANPMTNATFMAIGGLLASFVGTTGAAMALIRPLLETNRERKHVQHTIVFFIFVVCNCGGCLLPIGDPPLFLGYLRGVDFTWTLSLWPQWLFVNSLLLLIYCLLDGLYFYPREKAKDIQRDASQVKQLSFYGLWPHVALVGGVVLSVAFLDPSKPLAGTSWHPWMFLREVVQLGLVAISLKLGSDAVRRANNFNYHAIVEVAALFVGIFICMQPALQILHVAGPNLGIDTPAKFFWITGGLSSVLDNAPTYVVFFETARTVSGPGSELVAGVAERFLVPVSLGAVFMGAMTYIGNGPNFMVKAIAEKSGVRMPSFFGFVFFYSVPILLPVLLLVTWKYF